MNRCYRIIFNRGLSLWQVVSEIAHGRGKASRPASGKRAAAALACAAGLALAAPLPGWAQVTSTGDTDAPSGVASWSVVGASYIGDTGTGFATVGTGGGITAGGGILLIGRNATGTGTLTINDGTVATPLIVGVDGTGTLNLNGGMLGFGDQLILAYGTGSSGTLNIGSGATAGVANLATITGGSGTATVNFNHSGNYYLTNDGTAGGTAVVIEGGTQVNHLAGITTLSGASTYSGGTTITGGTLIADHDTALGTGAVTVDDAAGDDATLQITSTVTAFQNAITLDNGGTLDNAGGVAVPVTAVSTPGTNAVTVGAGGGAVTNRSGATIVGGRSGSRLTGGIGVALGTGTMANAGGITGGGGGGGSGGDGGVGGAGVSVATGGSVDNAATGSIAGGNGGTSLSDKGGAGGAGVILAGGTLANAGSITGGNAGDNLNSSFFTQSGGVGVALAGGGTVNHTGGSITGGAGAFDSGAYQTAGGTGVVITGDGNTLVTAAAINGGTGNAQGKAVAITGNDNVLELRYGASFTGGVAASGTGNVLRLGGTDASGSASFDVTNLGSGYSGFDTYEKTGSGEWWLTGTTTAVTNWTVKAGTLGITTNDASLGDASSTLTLDGGTLRVSSALSASLTHAIALGAGGGTVAAGSLGNTVVDSLISGTGGLTKTGSAWVILNNAGNSYTGGTTVNSAGLMQGAAGAFVADTAYTVNTGGILDLNDFALSMSSLSGSGGEVRLGSATLTVNQTDDTSYAGVIGETGSLVKTGAGKLTLSGANTYSGATTVSGGTLALAGSGSLVSRVTVDGAGAEFDNAGNVAMAAMTTNAPARNAVTVGTGGTVTNRSGATITGGNGFSAPSGGLGGGAGVVLSGGGTLTNAGSIAGGRGGNGPGPGMSSGGTGGTGVVLTGNGNTLVTSAAISGGAGGTGTSGNGAQGKAVTITGNDNTLELRSGYGFTGGIAVSGTGNVLALGGDTDASFNVGTLASDFAGFDAYAKNGASTWTLTNTTTAATPWTINAGKLVVTHDAGLGDAGSTLTLNGGAVQWNYVDPVSTRNITLGAGGGTIDVGNYRLTLSGAIGGVGQLRVAGTHTLLLTQANSYGGGTVIDSGATLYMQDAGTLGAGDVLNQGRLALRPSGDRSLANAISGNGTVAARADHGATLTLTGANSYSGRTDLSGNGTVQVGDGGTAGSLGTGGVRFVDGNATLAFNRSDDIVFAQDITEDTGTATGALKKLGAGTLTLTGTNSYSGGTTVSAGTLVIDGASSGGAATVNGGSLIIGSAAGGGASYAGAVTVNDGGVLGGHGVVTGNVAVNAGGTLAPGNSPGLLMVAGDLTLASGSTTRMEINGAARGTEYDAIDVSGTATLDGTLELDFGYVPTNGTQYRLIQAGSIVAAGSGETGFASITSNLGAGLRAIQRIDPTTYDILIDMVQQRYLAVAGPLTRNQSAVAGNLDTFSTSGQAATLIAGLNTLSAAALPVAFDALSGVEHAFAPTLVFQATRQFHDVLGERLTGGARGQAGLDGAQLAYGGGLGNLFDGRQEQAEGFWLRALASHVRIDGDRNAGGARVRGGGMALGADRQVSDTLRAGLAFAYAKHDADTDHGALDVDSYQLAAYGRWQGERAYLDASVSVGRHAIDTRRGMAFLNRHARADYKGDSAAFSFEAGWPLARGASTLVPYVALDGAALRRKGFAEQGADDANLRVAGRTDTALRSGFGARYTWSGATFSPAIDVAWLHDFGDARRRVDARFAATDAASFGIEGPERDRDRLALGLGLRAWTGGAVHVDVGYRGEFAGSDRDHALTATLRMAW